MHDGGSGFTDVVVATLERVTRPIGLGVLGLLALSAFWFSTTQSGELSDGYYGCHTNNSTVTGVRSFWIATLNDGRLTAMEPDVGSPQPKTFVIDTHHGSGAFNVTVDGHITATCESDD